LPASTPGQAFTQAPGTSCASANHCQTGVCDGDDLCARGCRADRDCDSGEVCYAEWLSYDENNGEHFCYFSDTFSYLPSGAECASGAECDSGVCAGFCDDGYACNSDSDCPYGACAGNCMDHCRSNVDCSSAEACSPWPMLTGAVYASWVPVCMDKLYTGSQAHGTSCSNDSQCLSDWCVEGICTMPCGITADCTGGLAGKKCEATSFTDSYGDPMFAMSFCL
jgi:hypothetical protein